VRKIFWPMALILLSGCGQSERPMPDNAAQATQSAAPEPAEPETNLPVPTEPVSACLVQDGQRLARNQLHTIGTEPFWGADTQGRCVTYSTPEDQAGTRVWTRFDEGDGQKRWTGALDGQPFVMTVRDSPGCSDGMSDRRYPIAVTLAVRGETRTGCAEPR
jgi:uncharacterized membrane protein